MWKEKILLPTTGSPFGERVVLPDGDYDVVVLATNDGWGLKPYRLILPHQLYVAHVQDVLSQPLEGSGRLIVAIPARSGEYIHAALKALGAEAP